MNKKLLKFNPAQAKKEIAQRTKDFEKRMNNAKNALETFEVLQDMENILKSEVSAWCEKVGEVAEKGLEIVEVAVNAANKIEDKLGLDKNPEVDTLLDHAAVFISDLNSLIDLIQTEKIYERVKGWIPQRLQMFSSSKKDITI
jgi:predicted TIM-barrel fold metal-dependent hydrolase